VDLSGHWLPIGSEGKQGGSRNVQKDPGDGEAVSRRAAALLLSFYGPLKESKTSDAVVTERYSIVIIISYMKLFLKTTKTHTNINIGVAS
jgi:hypothetical protein